MEDAAEFMIAAYNKDPNNKEYIERASVAYLERLDIL
jgi:hypothetical protein